MVQAVDVAAVTVAQGQAAHGQNRHKMILYAAIACGVIDLHQEVFAIPEYEGRIDPILCSNLGRLHIS
jgi:hypothetical protein